LAWTVLDAGIVSGPGGGIEKTLVSGWPHHHGTRYRSVLALVHPPRDSGFEVLRARAAAAGAELHDRAESFPFSLATVAWYAHLCREHRVRIWHGHDYKSDLIGLLLQPLFGFALVCTMHGWSARTVRARLYFSLDRHLIRRYEQVIAVSTDLHAKALALGIAADRLTLIQNGVDLAHYQRQSPTRPPSIPIRIGAAGRLVPEKGFDVLIQAVEQLLDEGHELELSIAGDGAQAAGLSAQIDRSRHRAHLRLLGFVEDLRPFYDSIDVFCVSSLGEGLPNVALEAMAMSLPIVATAVGGLPAVVDDGRNGLLCAPGSPDALREALRSLVASPALRASLGAAARLHVEQQHSLTARMAQLFAVYDRLPLAGAG
jgi:glycosyltransferase involved in cell wall biosynthesis